MIKQNYLRGQKKMNGSRLRVLGLSIDYFILDGGRPEKEYEPKTDLGKQKAFIVSEMEDMNLTHPMQHYAVHCYKSLEELNEGNNEENENQGPEA